MRPRIDRGGVLLEVVLALAILVVVGTFVLGTAADATRATRTAERRAEAIDLAASLIAEYRSGRRSLRDVGETSPLETDDPRAGRFEVLVEQRGSSHPGMSLVEVRVSAMEGGDLETVELARLVSLVSDTERAR